MIDDEDVEIAAMALDGGGTVIGTLIVLAIVGALAYFALKNDDECSKKHCDRGQPVLTHGECLCAERAK